MLCKYSSLNFVRVRSAKEVDTNICSHLIIGFVVRLKFRILNISKLLFILAAFAQLVAKVHHQKLSMISLAVNRCMMFDRVYLYGLLYMGYVNLCAWYGAQPPTLNAYNAYSIYAITCDNATHIRSGSSYTQNINNIAINTFCKHKSS